MGRYILFVIKLVFLAVVGKHYTAQEAADIGVIDRVFPPSSNILNCTMEYSQSIIGKSLFNRRVSTMHVKDAAKVGKSFHNTIVFLDLEFASTTSVFVKATNKQSITLSLYIA